MKTNRKITGCTKKSAIVSLVVMLAACSNTSAIEGDLTTLTNKIDSLSNKVDSLSAEVSQIKQLQDASDASTKEAIKSAELALEDVQRANERIDNIVSAYKK